MSLQSWLHNRRGEWYVVAQIALIAVLLFAPRLDGRMRNPSSAWPGFTLVIGGVFLAIGAGIAILGSVALGRNLSPYPKPKENTRLVESGIYSIVRHPIYSGIILFSLGWGLVWSSLAALIAATVLFWFFDLKSRREERWLETKFSNYASYKKSVKKLIPFIY